MARCKNLCSAPGPPRPRPRAAWAAPPDRRRGLSCVVAFYCAPLVMLLHTTRRRFSNATVLGRNGQCKTLQTHTHHTSPEMSRFLTALQLFLGALAVHAGTELLVLHVPRVPTNDGRPPLRFLAAVLAKACEHGRRTLSSQAQRGSPGRCGRAFD